VSRRPTLRDIAETLGVSTSAVSAALRGQGRVSDATAARIRAEASRAGYVPNKAAAGLRTARSDVVAVCLNDLSNPVFNEFLIHIEDELRSAGCTVLLGVAREDRQLQRRILQSTMENSAGGLLLCPVHGTELRDLVPLLAAAGRQAPFPCALFSRALDEAPLAQFVNDDVATGQMMAEKLVAAGHRTLHWLGGGQPTSTARDRLAGFCAALQQAGRPPPDIRHGPTSRRFGYATASEILKTSGSDAGFACFSDLIAFGVLAACADHGVVAGRTTSVIGVDDMAEAAFSRPPLSTVGVDKAWIGRQAARHVLNPADETISIHRSPPVFVRRATLR